MGALSRVAGEPCDSLSAGISRAMMTHLARAGVYSKVAVAGSRRTRPVGVRQPAARRSSLGDCSASSVGGAVRQPAPKHELFRETGVQ